MQAFVRAFFGVFIFQAAGALPATSLICKTLDGDFRLEAIVHHYTGDLYPDTLRIYEGRKQLQPEVKQYRNYNDEMFMILSLGSQDEFTDVGYVIEIERTYNNSGKALGNVERYTTLPEEDRKETKGSYQRLSCTLGPS